MKKFFILLIVAVMTALSTNAQGTFVSLQVDSLTYSLPSTVVFHGSYVGLSLQNGYTSAYIRIYVDGNFSNTAVVSPGNGNFTLSMSGFVSGQSYTYIPKVTFPFNDDGTSGTFTMPECSFSPSITGTSGICAGSSTTLNASPLGGTAYQWYRNGSAISGATFSSYTASITGSYTVRITYGGCTSTSPAFNFQVNGLPSVSITPASQSVCLGSSATMTANGGVNYVWSTGAVTNPLVITPSSSSTYIVTVTDANGCTGTASANMTVNSLPSISLSASPSTICEGASSTLTANGSGTFVWSTGQSGASISVSPLVTTTYTVTGTSNGCTNSATITVNVNPKPNVTASALPNTVCAGASTILSASGATTYQWNPGGMVGANVSATPLATTNYTVTATDANGCMNTATTKVTFVPSPIVTIYANPGTSVCSGTSVTFNLSGGSAYLTEPGNLTGPLITVSPSSTTTYVVTADNQGCTGSNSITINVTNPPVINISVSSNQICAGSSAILIANGPGLFSWSNGLGTGSTKIVSPTTTTTYTVTSTLNGCTGTAATTVTVNPLPTPTASATGPVCSGVSTTVNTTGGYAHYLWSTGDTTATFVTTLPVGTTNFTVTVTDLNGCVANTNTSAVVNSNPTVVITPSVNPICSGSSSMLTASGADSFIWTGGLGTNDTVFATPAITTNYSVTGTNLVGCTGIATINITVNPNPTVNAFASLNAICLGNSTVLFATGADLCSWSNGANGDSISVSPTVTTDYFVIGFTNGCTGIDTVTVMVNPNPVVSITASNNPICNGSSTSLSAIGAQTCSWSTGQTGSLITVSPTVSTNYFVIGTDTNGCVGVSSGMLIMVNPLPIITASALSSVICEGSHTQLSASGGISYSWSPINSSGQTVTANPSSTTTYVVTGLNINGCTNTAAVTVQVDPAVHLTTGGDQTICEGSSGVYISASNASSYHWSPTNLVSNGNIANTFAFPDTTTIFSVVGTAGTCSDTAFVLVSVIDNPLVDSVYYDLSNGMLYIEGLLQNLAFIRIGSVVYLPFSVSNTNAWFTNVNLINGQGIYVENASGCSYFFPYEDVSGISSETLPVEVSVYPNPFSEKFFVELPDGKYNVSLTNVSGQIVREMSASGNFEIHGEDLSSGIYFLNISSGEGNYLTKLIKN